MAWAGYDPRVESREGRAHGGVEIVVRSSATCTDATAHQINRPTSANTKRRNAVFRHENQLHRFWHEHRSVRVGCCGVDEPDLSAALDGMNAVNWPVAPPTSRIHILGHDTCIATTTSDATRDRPGHKSPCIPMIRDAGTPPSGWRRRPGDLSDRAASAPRRPHYRHRHRARRSTAPPGRGSRPVTGPQGRRGRRQHRPAPARPRP